MKHSKNTVALRAQFPSLRAWVVGNMNQAEIEAIRNAPRECVSFGGKHPLDDEQLAAGVFRAYRHEATWCLKYEFESLEHFGEMRGHRSSWAAFYHHALITAVAFMAEEDASIRGHALGPRGSESTAA